MGHIKEIDYAEGVRCQAAMFLEIQWQNCYLKFLFF